MVFVKAASHALTAIWTALWCVIAVSVSLAGWGRSDTYEPCAPFITMADETVRELHIRQGSAERIQQQIDEARSADPEAILVIELDGRFSVGRAPLRIGSRMILRLAPGTELIADPEWAGPVIEIRDAELAGVHGPGAGSPPAVIDGNMRSPTVIHIINSAKVSLSYLDIRGAMDDAVIYQGRGRDRFGEAGSIAHCLIRDHQGAGVRVRDAAQFIFIHNEIRDNRGAGVDIDSAMGLVADNVFRGNRGYAVITRGENGTVARNVIRAGPGIQLGPESRYNLLTYNRLQQIDGTGIALNGRGNSIYYNAFDQVSRPFTFDGADNIVAGHRHISGKDIIGQLGNNLYFNPPTRSHRHDDPVIVAGMGRRDIEIDTGSTTTSRPRVDALNEEMASLLADRPHMTLSEVQARIHEAREAHPDDYLVVHLRGTFISTEEAETGLHLPDYVSVVLDGFIIARAVDQARLVLMEGRGFSSLSGGYLHGGSGLAFHGIDTPGPGIHLIDGVTVSSMRAQGISTVANYYPPHTVDGRKRGRGDTRGRPVFIRGNNVVNSNGRGIWGHVASDIYYIDNVVADADSDGIDIDAWNHYSRALFNVLRGNTRSGVFIEEGVSFNTVYGNHLAANLGRHSTGILYYSFLARQARQRGDPAWTRFRNRNNMIVGNLVEAHRQGINTRYADGCIFAHNIIRHNDIGIRLGHHADRLFIFQNSIVDNLDDVSEEESSLKEGEFYSFPVWREFRR